MPKQLIIVVHLLKIGPGAVPDFDEALLLTSNTLITAGKQGDDRKPREEVCPHFVYGGALAN